MPIKIAIVALAALTGMLSGGRDRPDNGPALGSEAPGFSLPREDGEDRIALSDFRGERPVALIFGSYT